MTELIKPYSQQEENLNIWSHAFGLAISIIGTILLLIKGIKLNSTIHIVSFAIYGSSMIVLFLASTLYHSSKNPEKRRKLKTFDHAAIYFLIAGSYTPFTLLALKSDLGISIFAIAWFIGISGIILKLFFTGRFKLISTLSYLFMGWIIVFATHELIQNFTTDFLLWLVAGGLFYSIGAVLYLIKKLPFNHAIFHFCVLGGCFSLFMPVYLYL